MSLKFTPLADRVLIQTAPSEEKTASGIYIPDTAKEKPLKGSIVAVGSGKKDEPMFNQRLEFDLHLVKLECNCEWVESAILAALKTLQGEMPRSAKNCPHCNYLKDRWTVSQKDPTKLLD